MADSQRKLTACWQRWTRPRPRRLASARPAAARLALALALALPAAGCVEQQELFADGSAALADASAANGTVFHLISIGANAQDVGVEALSGLGAAMILRGDELLFWGNGGGRTTGRGFSIAVIDPNSHALVGAVETFDTFATRETGGDESARLAAFLDQIEDGRLVLAVVGDDAGVTENGVDGDLCASLQDDGTRAVLARLAELGSARMRDYCYRASWAMAAYKGAGRAEAEALVDGEPAHVTFTLP